ncbi:SDR family oxidoreductase [Candidatus Peregrinibacteria bacterium]|nr:SDR family oxidoreductase [Candidatus Peregrinibacteria bacterium]
MKILVAGGAGFIGSHLCHRLINNGQTVICVDNFITGQKENLTSLLNNPHFSLIEQDVCAPLDFEVHQIYHLASPASPLHYQKNPVLTIRSNTIGTLNLLELAKKNNAKILFASTSEIYGNPQKHPQDESYFGNVNPVGPRSCYDESKRCAESIFSAYHKECEVNIRIARIFNTYGPNMHLNDGRAVSNFIVSALQNDILSINGDGEQTRSFMYIDDLIDGLLKLMKAEITSPVNLGNPKEITIKQLAADILGLTKSKSKIIYKPMPQDDPVRRKPDISKAVKILNWKPTVSLETGLKKTIEYFRLTLKSG